MRRKAGTVLPIERELLAAAVALMARGTNEFYGFLIAHEMRDRKGAKDLIAYGNLYRVLERMEKQGWLASNWEDPEAAASERRPRRRIYTLTALGLKAAQETTDATVTASMRQQLAGQ